MADIIKIQDLFTGIALNVSISGTVPAISDGGYAWQVEVGGTALGDGAGNIKFNAGGTIKIRSLQENPAAVRAIWNDGGQTEGAILFVSDYTSSTIYPRRAYSCVFAPRSSWVEFYRIDEFNSIKIGSTITHTFAAGDNVLVFQRSGNVFTALVDGVEVGNFTDATYAPNGTRTRHGFIPALWVSGTGRLRSFEVLDSVTPASAPAAYTLTRVW